MPGAAGSGIGPADQRDGRRCPRQQFWRSVHGIDGSAHASRDPELQRGWWVRPGCMGEDGGVHLGRGWRKRLGNAARCSSAPRDLCESVSMACSACCVGAFTIVCVPRLHRLTWLRRWGPVSIGMTSHICDSPHMRSLGTAGGVHADGGDGPPASALPPPGAPRATSR